MADENRLSTVLLLIALGLLIYYLSCTKSSNSLDTLDNFENVKANQASTVQSKTASNFPNQSDIPLLESDRLRVESKQVLSETEDNNFKTSNNDNDVNCVKTE